MRQTRLPAQYRLHRRAALILSACFLLVGGTVGVVVVWRLQPERHLQYLRSSADHFIRQREWQRAAIQLGNIAKLVPGDAATLYSLGEIHLHLFEESRTRGDDDLQAALACFRRAAELDPTYLPARRSLLEFALYCGDEREARLRMDQLKALSADDPLVRLAAQTLGLATEGIDAPSPASVPDFKTPAELECLAEMLAPHVAAHPSDVDAAALLAMTYTRLNRKADREKILRAAERSEAGGGQVRLIRAECALREGDFAGARRWAESLLAHPEYQVSARRILAAGWQREAAADRSAARVHQRAALEQYRRILALEPTDAQAANNTAWILGEVLGQRCDAIELASQAVKRLPNPPAQLLDTYGWLLFRQNRPQDALGWLERAHVLQPDDATVRLHLAACYGRVGQTAKSQALWREALVARHVDEPKPIVSHAHVLLAGTTKDNPRMHR